MIKIEKLNNGFKVEGIDNVLYPDNGTLVFGANTVILLTDESDMVTFRSASNFDVLFSGLLKNITIDGESVTKDNIVVKFQAVANVEIQGGGGGNEDLIDLIEMDITTLNIPNGTTKIGKDAFNNCSSLTNVTIPDSVTSIGDRAFNNCTGLTNITIPNSVTTIGNSTFNNCTGLTNITIPNSVTTIGNSTFNNCTGLTSVTIGNSVTSIYNNAFSGCSSLTSINIPNSVTSIGISAFSGCRGLTSINIPNSVTSIGNTAFSGCRGLTSVTINATTPPTLGSSAFSSTNNCPIYVPAESVETYKAATNWSTYADRIQASPTE